MANNNKLSFCGYHLDELPQHVTDFLLEATNYGFSLDDPKDLRALEEALSNRFGYGNFAFDRGFGIEIIRCAVKKVDVLVRDETQEEVDRLVRTIDERKSVLVPPRRPVPTGFRDAVELEAIVRNLSHSHSRTMVEERRRDTIPLSLSDPDIFSVEPIIKGSQSPSDVITSIPNEEPLNLGPYVAIPVDPNVKRLSLEDLKKSDLKNTSSIRKPKKSRISGILEEAKRYLIVGGMVFGGAGIVLLGSGIGYLLVHHVEIYSRLKQLPAPLELSDTVEPVPPTPDPSNGGVLFRDFYLVINGDKERSNIDLVFPLKSGLEYKLRIKTGETFTVSSLNPEKYPLRSDFTLEGIILQKPDFQHIRLVNLSFGGDDDDSDDSILQGNSALLNVTRDQKGTLQSLVFFEAGIYSLTTSTEIGEDNVNFDYLTINVRGDSILPKVVEPTPVVDVASRPPKIETSTQPRATIVPTRRKPNYKEYSLTPVQKELIKSLYLKWNSECSQSNGRIVVDAYVENGRASDIKYTDETTINCTPFLDRLSTYISRWNFKGLEGKIRFSELIGV